MCAEGDKKGDETAWQRGSESQSHLYVLPNLFGPVSLWETTNGGIDVLIVLENVGKVYTFSANEIAHAKSRENGSYHVQIELIAPNKLCSWQFLAASFSFSCLVQSYAQLFFVRVGLIYTQEAIESLQQATGAYRIIRNNKLELCTLSRPPFLYLFLFL